MKKLILVVGFMLMVAGCNQADIVSGNISQSADKFEIVRRVVFYNGINGEYMLEIRGYCSLGNFDAQRELSVTCKVGSGYKKHFLGLSDNVTYFVEQIDAANVSGDQYKVVFKPSAIVPDIEIR